MHHRQHKYTTTTVQYATKHCDVPDMKLTRINVFAESCQSPRQLITVCTAVQKQHSSVAVAVTAPSGNANAPNR